MMERRLAAVLAADMVGYSRLMGTDEKAALTALNAYRHRIDEEIQRAGGRIFGSAGDSVIAEFQSPVAAVDCALQIQQQLADYNAGLPKDRRIQFRVGVNLGDVVAEGDNLLGDGVNIAARLESLAPPGGICISKQVADHIGGRVDAEFAVAGARELKNVSKPVEIWVWPPDQVRHLRHRPRTWRWAAVAAVLMTGAFTVVWFGSNRPRTPDLPSGPRIALVPFKSIGVDPSDSYFSEGLTRDINALLAKFSNLFVIAPEAAELFRDNPECGAIREILGADYFLTGTVQRSAERLRLTTTFTDAESCRQLTPPGPFDVDLSVANVLDIQYEIARKVAAQIGSSDAPLFKSAVMQAIREKAPDSLDAYECVLLSYWFYQTFGLEAYRKARDCLLKTVAAEPGYSLGWSRLAFNYIESKKRGHDTSPDWARLAREAANQALDEDQDNPDAFYALAILSRMVGDGKDVFLTNAKRAIELNPNDSWILADLGIFLAYSGEWEQGKEWITRARALNPKLNPGFGYAWTLHSIVLGDYQDAINRQLGAGATRPMTMASLAASYALNGDLKNAQAVLAEWQERFPDRLKDPLAPFRARHMPADLIEKLGEGLQRAGLDVPPIPDEE